MLAINISSISENGSSWQDLDEEDSQYIYAKPNEMIRFLRTPIMMLVVMTLAACIRNPVTGKKQFAVMSEAKEVALGKAYDPQIVAQFGLYQNETIQEYINSRGNEMAAISHRPHLAYEFKIVDSPVVNAFAVPGGYVYFTRGIMAHFNNEAEFSGVLGHEIGHITARHSVVQQRNATFAQLGLIAGMIASPQFAQMAEPASAGVQLLLLKFGRDAESQSDELGVEYSTKIGYDAHEMAGFFKTLARKSAESGQSPIPEFMSTHPDPLNRKERVHELANQWQSEVEKSEWIEGRNSYLQMIDDLVYGEDPRQGFVEDWVFYHPELKFQLPVPNSWRYANSPQQFQMAPEDGKAIMFLSLAGGESLAASAAALAEKYQLQVMSQKSISVNGLTAYELVGQQVSQEATTEAPAGTPTMKARIVLVEYGGLTYELTAACAPSDYNALLPSFNATQKGFEILRDTDKLNRQPERIDIKTVSSAQTLTQALTSYGVPNDRLEEMAVLNGMELTDQVPAGTMLKTVE